MGQQTPVHSILDHIGVTFYSRYLEAHFTGEANEDTQGETGLEPRSPSFPPISSELLEGWAKSYLTALFHCRASTWHTVGAL